MYVFLICNNGNSSRMQTQLPVSRPVAEISNLRNATFLYNRHYRLPPAPSGASHSSGGSTKSSSSITTLTEIPAAAGGAVDLELAFALPLVLTPAPASALLPSRFGVAVRANRHVNPPPHEYLDNSAVCHNGGANGGGCTINSLPGQLTVSQGVQTVLLEHNSLEVRNDINYSQGYTTINVGPHPTTVVQRHNLVVEV